MLDLEAAAHARVAELRLARDADDRDRSHRAMLGARQQQMLIEAQTQQERWRSEDEDRLMRMRLSSAAAERKAAEAEKTQQQRDLESAFLEVW